MDYSDKVSKKKYEPPKKNVKIKDIFPEYKGKNKNKTLGKISPKDKKQKSINEIIYNFNMEK